MFCKSFQVRVLSSVVVACVTISNVNASPGASNSFQQPANQQSQEQIRQQQMQYANQMQQARQAELARQDQIRQQQIQIQQQLAQTRQQAENQRQEQIRQQQTQYANQMQQARQAEFARQEQLRQQQLEQTRQQTENQRQEQIRQQQVQYQQQIQQARQTEFARQDQIRQEQIQLQQQLAQTRQQVQQRAAVVQAPVKSAYSDPYNAKIGPATEPSYQAKTGALGGQYIEVPKQNPTLSHAGSLRTNQATVNQVVPVGPGVAERAVDYASKNKQDIFMNGASMLLGPGEAKVAGQAAYSAGRAIVTAVGEGLAKKSASKEGAAIVENQVANKSISIIKGDTQSSVANVFVKIPENAGNYRPPTKLPSNKSGEPVPSSNTAHSQIGTNTSRKAGDFTTARVWGDEGKPMTTVEFTDHGRPMNHSFTHQHRFVENPTGGTMQRGGAESYP